MIGGNITAIIQTNTSSKNAFGEIVRDWNNVSEITGFLDFIGGDGGYKSNYNGAIKETTNVFICDYTPLDIEPTRSRMIIEGKIYDILMIDNPMNLNQHLEFMLKYNEVID